MNKVTQVKHLTSKYKDVTQVHISHKKCKNILDRNRKMQTLSIIALVWPAETQNRARDSMMGVAGNPTTTVPSPRFKHSLPNILEIETNN